MKKVIIVGATSGIGRELAKLYIHAGNKVAITGRRKELLESLQKECADVAGATADVHHGEIIAGSFDVTGRENISHIQSLIAKLGGLDLLIYNSGFGDPSATLDWTIDKKTIDINVNGFAEIVNWSFNYFVNQGYGQIAATSSVAANRGNSFAPAYSASKAFISCYLEGLHLKARRLKLPVYITDIQPGFVKTKESNVAGQFWVVPVAKAARQMFEAIEERRFRVYVSKRWRLVASLMRSAPAFIYRQFG